MLNHSANVPSIQVRLHGVAAPQILLLPPLLAQSFNTQYVKVLYPCPPVTIVLTPLRADLRSTSEIIQSPVEYWFQLVLGEFGQICSPGMPPDEDLARSDPSLVPDHAVFSIPDLDLKKKPTTTPAHWLPAREG